MTKAELRKYKRIKMQIYRRSNPVAYRRELDQNAAREARNARPSWRKITRRFLGI